jgi:hypothetical protein
MGSGAIIYIPSFIQIGSVIQKLIRVIQRHREHGGRMNLLQESTRLKIEFLIPVVRQRDLKRGPHAARMPPVGLAMVQTIIFIIMCLNHSKTV